MGQINNTSAAWRKASSALVEGRHAAAMGSGADTDAMACRCFGPNALRDGRFHTRRIRRAPQVREPILQRDEIRR
ncbi:hypothetical protein MSIM_00520 [Mycobacterium simiae]|nr:hypothetical protein MSIM_00520 [Mycobacterium simiae]